jgi:hypothetical protein
MPEIAQRISDAAGRSIRYVDIDPDEKHRMLVEAGMEPYFADALDELFSERRKGAESTVRLPPTNGSASGPPPSPSSPPATRPCSRASPAHDHTRRGLPLAGRSLLSVRRVAGGHLPPAAVPGDVKLPDSCLRSACRC